MIRRPPRSTLDRSSAASDVYKRQVYDMSVGYDLAGIQSPAIQRFIASLKDARPIVDRLRAELPAEYAQYLSLIHI